MILGEPQHVPHNRRLQEHLAVLLDGFHHLGRLGLLLRAHRDLEIDAHLFRFKVWVSKETYPC